MSSSVRKHTVYLSQVRNITESPQLKSWVIVSQNPSNEISLITVKQGLASMKDRKEDRERELVAKKCLHRLKM